MQGAVRDIKMWELVEDPRGGTAGGKATAAVHKTSFLVRN